MSQSDLIFENQPRNVGRADLNAIFAALGSMQKGPSAPSGVQPGWLWLDEDTPSSTVWTVKQWDGADWIVWGYIDTVANTFKLASAVSTSAARGHLAGWAYQPNGSDPTHDIDIPAGRAIDTTGVAAIEGVALTKRYDAAWAAGNGNGGRRGTAADGEWWIHAVLDVDDQLVDYIFDQSRTSPSLPSGYTLFANIGWFQVDSSAIVAFYTWELPGGGLAYRWSSPTLDISMVAELNDTRFLKALKVPTGIAVESLARYEMYDAANSTLGRICCPSETDVSPALGTAPLSNIFSHPNTVGVEEMRVRTDTSGRVAVRAAGPTTVDTFYAATLGFDMARG